MPPRPPSLDAFLAELALGWQRLVLYQAGHPARAKSISGPYRMLTALLAPVGELALGVTRDALVGPEERLTSVPAKKLAGALYQAGAGVVRLREGIEPFEIETLLQHLPRHRGWYAERSLWEELAAAGAVHLVIEPLDFSQVIATDSLDEVMDDEGEPLWDQILRRLLADGRFAAGTAAAAPQAASLAEVLRVLQLLVQRHGAEIAAGGGGGAAGARQGDQLAALGGLLASVLTGHLATRRDEGPRRSTLQHLAELLGAIPEGLRERLLDAALGELVGSEEGAPELEAYSASVPAAQIVSTLRRLREQRMAFSPHAQRLVEELVTAGGYAMAPSALAPDPEAIADQLHRLFAEDDIDRVGAGTGDRLVLELPQLPGPPPRSPELDQRLDGLVEERQLAVVAGVLLELLQNPVLDPGQLGGVAQRIESVFRGLLHAGRLRAAVNLVERLQAISVTPGAPASVKEATAHCLERLRQKEATAALLDATRGAVGDGPQLLQRLVTLLGPPVVVQLLLALGEEEDLGRRRQTFALLLGLGGEMVPHAIGLLGDERWYVVRNMLSLLRQAGARLPLAALRPVLEHADARVRGEAVRCLATAPADATPELLGRLLADPDERVTETAVSLIAASRLAAGREPLLALLRRADPLGRHRSLRVKVLHALGELGDPRVLGELKPFFRTWLPQGSPEERRAAFVALARYPADVRNPLAQQGLRSLDPEIRSVCRQLLAGGVVRPEPTR